MRFISTFLTLFLVAAVAPLTARASCGDYVLVGGGTELKATPAMPAATVDGGTLATHFPAGVPTCHGPHCRRHAPGPAAPEQGPSSRLFDQAAQLGSGAGNDGPRSHGTWAASDPRPLSAVQPAIERPPRGV